MAGQPNSRERPQRGANGLTVSNMAGQQFEGVRTILGLGGGAGFPSTKS